MVKFKNFNLKPENIKKIQVEGQKLSIVMNSGNTFTGSYENIEECKAVYLDLTEQKEKASNEQIKNYNDSRNKKRDIDNFGELGKNIEA